MQKRTTVVLESDHVKAVKRIMEERNCSQTRAIGVLLDRGIEAEYLRGLYELVTLKTFYYLRQIAKERGPDFVNAIEQGFEESKEQMLKALRDGFSHVGK